jgi:hypothetical protein
MHWVQALEANHLTHDQRLVPAMRSRIVSKDGDHETIQVEEEHWVTFN